MNGVAILQVFLMHFGKDTFLNIVDSHRIDGSITWRETYLWDGNQQLRCLNEDADYVGYAGAYI